MNIADSFSDESDFLPELSPEEKMGAFIEGMRLSAIDLVEFRCALETRAFVAKNEAELWQVKNAIELVLSSIQAEHDARKPNLRIVT